MITRLRFQPGPGQAADLVLANGRRVTASDTGDADLYWALRGGGSTFGVVTVGRYRLHPSRRS